MYYVATYGDLGLVVEFFPNDGPDYLAAVSAAHLAHCCGELDAYTYGKCE